MAGITKRLLIRASNDYENDFRVVPVNTGVPIEIESEIGVFSLKINIKQFDGSAAHRANSLYNLLDDRYLDGSKVTGSASRGPQASDEQQTSNPNMRFEVSFRPRAPIPGSELLFGNDFTSPIKDYVPTTLLSTGLKFFTWFINSTVKGDVYNEKPYLYSLALNSFTYMSVKNEASGKRSSRECTPVSSGPSDIATSDSVENLNSNIDNLLDIPSNSAKRKSFFNKLTNCESFVFNEGSEYTLRFDTNFIKLADSKYSVSIPTFGRKTFDINVLSYANENLDNFNWCIKQGGYDGVGQGNLGLIVNFALENETD